MIDHAFRFDDQTIACRLFTQTACKNCTPNRLYTKLGINNCMQTIHTNSMQKLHTQQTLHKIRNKQFMNRVVHSSLLAYLFEMPYSYLSIAAPPRKYSTAFQHQPDCKLHCGLQT